MADAGDDRFDITLLYSAQVRSRDSKLEIDRAKEKAAETLSRQPLINR